MRLCLNFIYISILRNSRRTGDPRISGNLQSNFTSSTIVALGAIRRFASDDFLMENHPYDMLGPLSELDEMRKAGRLTTAKARERVRGQPVRDVSALVSTIRD